MSDSIEKLYAHLEERGLRGSVASIARLGDLRADIEGRHAQGAFDEAFYQERLRFFDFAAPAELPAASSLIVVAVPRPQTRLTFAWRGTTRTLILPPTYWRDDQTRDEVETLLRTWSAPRGYRVVRARLPQKALAVRSGLAEYGRNNITYVAGMGSFYQPVTCFSDLPCPEDAWRQPQMMERCQDCRACLLKCPTGAITAERFLLHAERCLVFHNERSPDHPFPAWIDPAWHNTIVGCMLCQQACPVENPFLGWFEGDQEFSEDETGLLLRCTAPDQLPPALKDRLARLDLLGYLDVLPRNLAVFFGNSGR